MDSYEDMDDEMRRILDEGEASAQPADLFELHQQLAAQSTGPGEEMPKGTKVVFADAASPEVEPGPSV